MEATTIGLAAAIFTSIAFIPQAIKTIRTKQTKDLSLAMYICVTIGLSLWLLYGIWDKDLPVIVSNCVTLPFTIATLVMIIKYR